jgi:hypothetical protein
MWKEFCGGFGSMEASYMEVEWKGLNPYASLPHRKFRQRQKLHRCYMTNPVLAEEPALTNYMYEVLSLT